MTSSSFIRTIHLLLFLLSFCLLLLSTTKNIMINSFLLSSSSSSSSNLLSSSSSRNIGFVVQRSFATTTTKTRAALLHTACRGVTSFTINNNLRQRNIIIWNHLHYKSITSTSLQLHNNNILSTSSISKRTTKLTDIVIKATSIIQRRNKNNHIRMMNTDSKDDNIEASSKQPNLLHVAMCQFHVTDDKIINQQTASQYIDDAGKKMNENDNNKYPRIIVLPEIWNSPYATLAFPDYAEIVPEVNDTIIDPVLSSSSYILQQKAIEHSIYIVGGSIPEKVLRSNDNNKYDYYNTCIVYHPNGTIIAKHRKVHLFDIDIPNGITFKESDTLSSGNNISYFTIDNTTINIGIGICYDIRFQEYATILCQKYHCQCLIYPGAFNMITGPAHWELLQRSRAIDNQCYIITASPARSIEVPVIDDTNTEKATKPNNKYPHYTAWGHSTVVNPWGDVIATCNEQSNIVTSYIDLSYLNTVRQSIPITYQRRNDIYELNEVAKMK